MDVSKGTPLLPGAINNPMCLFSHQVAQKRKHFTSIVFISIQLSTPTLYAILAFLISALHLKYYAQCRLHCLQALSPKQAGVSLLPMNEECVLLQHDGEVLPEEVLVMMRMVVMVMMMMMMMMMMMVMVVIKMMIQSF